MLTTVMVLIKQHNLTRELQRDYAWIVSLQLNPLKTQYHNSQRKGSVLRRIDRWRAGRRAKTLHTERTIAARFNITIRAYKEPQRANLLP